jgi:hypothetical protein
VHKTLLIEEFPLTTRLGIKEYLGMVIGGVHTFNMIEKYTIWEVFLIPH